MIFTHCGLLGDFLLSLPVASWYYKTHGQKITFVLADVPSLKPIDKLLQKQPFTEAVYKVPFKVEHFGCGGQPYNLNPNDFGIRGEYVNIGFRDWPRYEWVPYFYAQEHGFGVDEDFILYVEGEPNPTAKNIIAKPILKYKGENLWEKEYMGKHEWGEYILDNFTPLNSDYLDLNNDFYDNLVICKQSKQTYCIDGGISVALDLMGVDYTLFYKERPNHPGWWFESVYFKPNNHKRNFIAVSENSYPKADPNNW